MKKEKTKSHDYVRRVNKVSQWYSCNRYVRALVNFLPIGGAIDTFLTTKKSFDPITAFFNEIDEKFLKSQQRKQITGMLGASIGDWSFVAQRLDIKRDVQKEIEHILAELEAWPAFMVILGEPGAGKSTLMRRIGMDIALKGRRVLELRPGMNRTQEWFSLVTNLSINDKPPILLIDDIFRCDGIEDLLKDPLLDCIIIGTSRLNEDDSGAIQPVRGLKFLELPAKSDEGHSWPMIANPSQTELAELRKKPECKKYSNEEWSQLTTMKIGKERIIAPLLVIMLQVAGGEPFDQIISDTLIRLKKKYIDTYRAFGIICSFHRLGLSTPTELIVALNGGYKYIRRLKMDVLYNKKSCGARGLIFPEELSGNQELWRTAHELIAETAAQTEYCDFIEDTYDDLTNLAESGDVDSSYQLPWVLLEMCNRGEVEFFYRIDNKSESVFRKLVNNKNFMIWMQVFYRFARIDMVEYCLDFLDFKEEENRRKYLSILFKYGGIKLAFSKIEMLLDEYKDDKGLIGIYMNKVGRCGNKDQINMAINRVSNYLKKIDDPNIYCQYISFVANFGNEDQINIVNDKMCEWLDNHYIFTGLLRGYLSLLQKTRDEKRVSIGILKVLDWLKTNYYRGIVLILHALVLNIKDIELKQFYFDAIKKKSYGIGTDKGLLLSLCAGVAWDFKPDIEIRSLYEKALKMPHPLMNKTRFFYAKYLVKIEDFLTALPMLKLICNSEFHSPVELDLYATCLAKVGKFEEAEHTWLDCIDKGAPKGKFANNLAKFYRDQGRFDEARVQFKRALKWSPNFFWAEKEWGELEYLDGDMSEAWLHFEKAIKLIPAHKDYDEARQSIQERAQEVFGKIPG